jgi:hypothetical protein
VINYIFKKNIAVVIGDSEYLIRVSINKTFQAVVWVSCAFCTSKIFKFFWLTKKKEILKLQCFIKNEFLMKISIYITWLTKAKLRDFLSHPGGVCLRPCPLLKTTIKLKRTGEMVIFLGNGDHGTMIPE